MGQESSLEAAMVVIGRIGAPFGVKGGTHVQSFTQPSENLLRYKQWHLKLKGQWQKPVSLLDARSQGKNFVVTLKGYETREAVAALTQAEIGVPRSELPPLGKDEYYWHDLIGLTVFGEDGHVFGQIEGLLETGANEVLVVKNAQKEHLIPYILGETVQKVDLEAQALYVNWDTEF